MVKNSLKALDRFVSWLNSLTCASVRKEHARYKAALQEMHNTRSSAFYDRETDFRRTIERALYPERFNRDGYK